MRWNRREKAYKYLSATGPKRYRERESEKANDRIKIFAQDVNGWNVLFLFICINSRILLWSKREKSFTCTKTSLDAQTSRRKWKYKNKTGICTNIKVLLHSQTHTYMYTQVHAPARWKLTEKKHTSEQQIYTRLSLYYCWQQMKILGNEKDKNQVKMSANKCVLHSNAKLTNVEKEEDG